MGVTVREYPKKFTLVWLFYSFSIFWVNIVLFWTNEGVVFSSYSLFNLGDRTLGKLPVSLSAIDYLFPVINSESNYYY